jgi:hypothetical protein
MTVLSACSSAAIRLVGRKLTTVFSSEDTFELELSDLVQDVAVEIAKRHDWQALTKLATITGDASGIAFSLPDDYDRMPLKAKIHSSRWSWSTFTPARDLDQWLDEMSFSTVGAPGFWTILDGKMQIYPAMGADETAKFYYISTYIAKDSNDNPKAVINDDGDTFFLDDRLLTLGLIWRWRAQKRLEYAEDLQNFEIAIAQEISRDRGSRMITLGGGYRGGMDIRTAYPGALGPFA